MGYGRREGGQRLQNIFLILQDPREEGLVAAKRCKLGSLLKRAAYEPAAGSRKKKRLTREEDREEEDENLVSSQTMYL